MKTTAEALESWESDEYGKFLKVNGVEIRLEPLIFDGQMYVAVYYPEDNLIADKVVVKAGKL